MPPEERSLVLNKKSSIATKKNKNNSCGYLALAVAKYLIENGYKNIPEWTQIMRDTKGKTTKIARKFCRNAGVSILIPMTS